MLGIRPRKAYNLDPTTYGCQQWLVDIAASGLSGHYSLQPDAILPPAAAVEIADKHAVAMAGASKNQAASASKTTTASTTTATSSTTAPATTPTDQNTATIDILILYTDGLAARLGSGLSVRIDNLLALSNQAYIDSGIKARLRMVAGKQLAYTDQNNNSTALSDLFAKTIDPFKAVGSLRDNVGADVVTLIRPFYASAQSSCGVGYIGGCDIALLHKFDAGFQAGAKSVKPDIKIQAKYLSLPPDCKGFNDPAAGTETANGMYDGGADIIFAAAGGSGTGVFHRDDIVDPLRQRICRDD